MKKSKRKLAAVLAAVMILTNTAPVFADPVTGSAETDQQTGEILTVSESRVDRIYESMTSEERIAQMFMMQARSWKGNGAVTALDDDLKDLYAHYHFGGFISSADNMEDTLGMLGLTKALKAYGIMMPPPINGLTQRTEDSRTHGDIL